MNDFWKNISRYPRFLVSSLAGLILVILAPIRNLLKSQKFRFLVPIICIVLIFTIFIIVMNMTGI